MNGYWCEESSNRFCCRFSGRKLEKNTWKVIQWLDALCKLPADLKDANESIILRLMRLDKWNKNPQRTMLIWETKSRDVTIEHTYTSIWNGWNCNQNSEPLWLSGDLSLTTISDCVCLVRLTVIAETTNKTLTIASKSLLFIFFFVTIELLSVESFFFFSLVTSTVFCVPKTWTYTPNLSDYFPSLIGNWNLSWVAAQMCSFLSLHFLSSHFLST